MDTIQKIIKDIANIVPGCFENRQMFSSALSDLIPNNKLQINLLLNAFDENVVTKLTNTTDPALSALQMIKTLQDLYGISNENAFWSVETWCIILGLEKITAAINILKPEEGSNNTTKKKPGNDKEYIVKDGVYKAGSDIPAGELLVKVHSLPKYKIYIKTGKTPATNDTSVGFTDQCYISIKDGGYLKIDTTGDDKNLKITVQKV